MTATATIAQISTSKSPLLAADLLEIADSAASYASKKATAGDVAALALAAGITTSANPGNAVDARLIVLGKDSTFTASEGGPSTHLADWVITTGTSDFSAGTGTQLYTDPILQIGYNAKNGGRRATNEQELALNFEADFAQWNATRTVVEQVSEVYFEHRSRDTGSQHNYCRPLMFQMMNLKADADNANNGPIRSALYAVGGRDGDNGATFVAWQDGNAGTDYVQVANISQNSISLSRLDGTAGSKAATKDALVLNTMAQVSIGGGYTSPGYTQSIVTLGGGGSPGVIVLNGAVDDRAGNFTRIGGMVLGLTNGGGGPSAGGLASLTSQVLGIDCTYVPDAAPGLVILPKSSQTALALDIRTSSNAAAIGFDNAGRINFSAGYSTANVPGSGSVLMGATTSVKLPTVDGNALRGGNTNIIFAPAWVWSPTDGAMVRGVIPVWT